MSYWLDEPRYQHELVTVRTLWVTIALSLLVHAVALLIVLQDTRLLAPAGDEPDLASERLQVRLAGVTPPEPVPPPQPPREIVALAKPPVPAPRARMRAPPPMAAVAPAPPAPAILTAPPTAPSVATPPRTAPPVEGDLWSYIQARRRERGEPETPAVDARKADPNASLAANLPQPATGAATAERNRGGGIFELKRVRYDDAAFEFFGWNTDMGRRTPQLIEVRKGDNPDMRTAVVRRMIQIIREHSKGDFLWQSPRRDHDVVLSARLADNAALESFLLNEFFDERSQTH